MTRNRPHILSALRGAAIAAFGCAVLPCAAIAQESANGLDMNLAPTTDYEKLNEEFVGLDSSFNGGRIDLPAESVGSRLFNLDVADTNCLLGDQNCLTRTEAIDMGYNKALKTTTKGLELSVTPRAALRFNGESSSAIVGAIVKVGEDLKDTKDFESNTWYMFAGADAEAVTYSPDNMSRFTNGEFHLQDRIIVGDAQAGIGYKIGDADVSLGYFRREVVSFGREVESNGVSFKEDAAALSFTWRR